MEEILGNKRIKNIKLIKNQAKINNYRPIVTK